MSTAAHSAHQCVCPRGPATAAAAVCSLPECPGKIVPVSALPAQSDAQ